MDGPKGWVDRGGYEGSLSGGSEEGYHTFAYSTISDDTDYRVRVLAKDGREIGRLTFRARIGEPPPTQTEID